MALQSQSIWEYQDGRLATADIIKGLTDGKVSRHGASWAQTRCMKAKTLRCIPKHCVTTLSVPNYFSLCNRLAHACYLQHSDNIKSAFIRSLPAILALQCWALTSPMSGNTSWSSCTLL